MMSSVLVAPCNLMVWAVTETTGLELVRFADGMREPVTTSSCTLVEAGPASVEVAGAAWARAPVAEIAKAAVVIMDDAIRRARVVECVKSMVLQHPDEPVGGLWVASMKGPG